MKKKDIQSYRQKKVEELTKTLAEKKTELTKHRLSLYAGKVKNVRVMRGLRKDIAQLLSLKREKEMGAV